MWYTVYSTVYYRYIISYSILFRYLWLDKAARNGWVGPLEGWWGASLSLSLSIYIYIYVYIHIHIYIYIYIYTIICYITYSSWVGPGPPMKITCNFAWGVA